MSGDNLFFNGVFYIILTFFFIYIFIKEKKINEKIKLYRDKFSDFLILNMKIKNNSVQKYFKLFVESVETLLIALILVLVIQKFYIGNFKVPSSNMTPTINSNDRIFTNMVIYKFKKPKRGDIVVFKEPIKNKELYIKRVMGLPGERIFIRGGVLYIDENPILGRKYSNSGEIRNRVWVVPKKGDLLHVIPGRNYKKEYKKYDIDVNEMQKELRKDSKSVNQFMPDLLFRINGEDTGKILDVIHNKKYLNKLMAGEIVEIRLNQNYYLALEDNFNSKFDSRMWGFIGEDKIYGKVFLRFWPLERFGTVK